MRIAIIASGSRGDVQPYIALGNGLADAGHIVKIITRDGIANAVAMIERLEQQSDIKQNSWYLH